MTLTEFLLECIAEDARRRMAYWHDMECAVAFDASAECGCGSQERVLVECEAKRRIVDWAAPVVRLTREATDRPGVYNMREVRHVNEDADDLLAILALPYSDHPDYNPEWRL